MHVMHLLCVAHKLQSALDRGMEARLVQIDFSAAFDRVNHLGIIRKLRSALSCLFRHSSLVHGLNMQWSME